jgi:beta-glucosidase
MRTARIAAVLIALALSGLTVRAQDPPPYKNASLPVADRVKDLIGRMTLEEKFWQLYMIPGDLDDPAHDYSHGVFGLQISGTDARQHAERINAIQKYFVEQTRLGIPIIPFEEALHGLKAPGATMFPQAIGLAATWDTAMMRRVADASAREARSRGIRDALSPVINIADDVRWGRVEETYGEDPWLTSEMARAFVAGFEFNVVIAKPKHFVANVVEGGRDSYPVFHNERMLMERYFPPFEAALKTGARSIMTSYNSIDGAPATQNPRLLNEILKRDWKLALRDLRCRATGGATVLHMTEPSTPVAAAHAINSGLDVIFQSSYPQFRPYFQAFQQKLIPDDTINAAVWRVLHAKFELGLFETPYVDVDAAATTNGRTEHVVLARAAARVDRVAEERAPTAAAVEVRGIRRRDRHRRHRGGLGGYSGPGNNVVSILDGIRSRHQPHDHRASRPRPRPRRRRTRHHSGRSLLDDARRSQRARPHRRVLRQQRARRHTRDHAHRSACRLSLDAQLTGPRHSDRLVLGALDVNAHGAGRRCSPHRHRRQRRLPTVDRRPAGDRQLGQAVVRYTHRRRGSRAGHHARTATRVLRERRQRQAG